jgi:hypothetical protein
VPAAPGTGVWLAGATDDVTVEIDGGAAALSPRGRLVALPAGLHLVHARRPGHLDVNAVVTVEDGRPTEVALPRIAVDADGRVARTAVGTATLAVDGPAGAVVAVDGKPLGIAPNQFRLAAGTHRLVVTAKNSAPDERVVVLAPQKTTTVTAAPTALLAPLVVVTAEPGVSVLVDGVARGATDPRLVVDPLPRGLHTVTLQQAGRATVEEAVYVEAGAPPFAFGPLAPVPASTTATATTTTTTAPTTSATTSGPTVTVRFAPSLLGAFADVRRERTSAGEVAPLFAALRAHAEPTCALAQSHRATSRAALLQLVRPEALSVPPFRDAASFRSQLIAGCYNFFQMNDVHPEVDFELIKRLFPTDRFECLGVGFVQPYMMHAALGCERLTMLDFDWRIHDGHAQLLRLFAQGRLRGEEGVRAALQDLSLGWVAKVAHREHMRPQTPGSLEAICASSAHPGCVLALATFQERYSTLKRIDLEVAELQEAAYDFGPGTTPVIFLSNAIEPIYTSRTQFDELLRRVRAGLADGGRALFIHHAGGTNAFGVYALDAGPAGTSTVQTLCRDTFVARRKPELPLVRYDTWFDDVATAGTTKTPVPSCARHPLLRVASSAP